MTRELGKRGMRDTARFIADGNASFRGLAENHLTHGSTFHLKFQFLRFSLSKFGLQKTRVKCRIQYVKYLLFLVNFVPFAWFPQTQEIMKTPDFLKTIVRKTKYFHFSPIAELS